jgi:hypothetical protein
VIATARALFPCAAPAETPTEQHTIKTLQQIQKDHINYPTQSATMPKTVIHWIVKRHHRPDN